MDLLTGDRPTGDLFEEAVGSGAPPDVAARWVINELPRELGDRPLDETPLTGKGLAALVLAVESGEITGTAAKDVFAEMVQRGGDPRQIIAERGLAQVSDEAAIAAIRQRGAGRQPGQGGPVPRRQDRPVGVLRRPGGQVLPGQSEPSGCPAVAWRPLGLSFLRNEVLRWRWRGAQMSSGTPGSR